ncbi:hypothetical protein TW95_gp1804 [Pandoravirus inopinatum]|uniref:Uncharacterized protein n=1 Tax=Pandoravirus inopinatum TaxID=1605721 RepID=A0A0B5IZZ7_9VIRU|nr:hypothetical protein TW95_gp1804 [Pandoravirus inopinatum]AJF98538.1 hypothetical protein [Pandoravirus inopinatum]
MTSKSLCCVFQPYFFIFPFFIISFSLCVCVTRVVANSFCPVGWCCCRLFSGPAGSGLVVLWRPSVLGMDTQSLLTPRMWVKRASHGLVPKGGRQQKKNKKE